MDYWCRGGLALNAVQPLLEQQRQMVKICLSKQDLVGLTPVTLKY